MMDFPNSPTAGQSFTSGGTTWVWTVPPSAWKATAGPAGGAASFLPLTGGTLAGPGNLTVRGGVLVGTAGSVPAAGSMVLNANTVAPPAGLSSSVYVVGADTGQASLGLDAFGAGAPLVVGRRARGTAASQTAVQSGDTLLFLAGSGYGASAYSNSFNTSITLGANENWTASAQGSQMVFRTNPNGATAPVGSLVLAGNTATFSAGVTIDNTGVGGRITATNGFRSQSGSGGAQQGNVFNLQWPGGGSFHLWVDTTDTGSINVTPCDERLKTNLKAPTVDALGAINGIALKQFDWLANDLVPEHHEDLGFTAQQLAKVIPGAVDLHEDNPDQMASVQLTPIVAHLIGAVQQLKAEIDALKGKRAPRPS